MKHIYLILIASFGLLFCNCTRKKQSPEQYIAEQYKDTIFQIYVQTQLRDSIVRIVYKESEEQLDRINEDLRYNGSYTIAQLNGIPSFRVKMCNSIAVDINAIIERRLKEYAYEFANDTLQKSFWYAQLRARCIMDSIKVVQISKDERKAFYELSFKNLHFQATTTHTEAMDTLHTFNIARNVTKKVALKWQNNRFSGIIKEDEE